MSYLFLSPVAAQIAVDRQIVDPREAAICEVSLVESRLLSATSPVCLIADVSTINDKLARVVASSQSATGVPVGIVPFQENYADSLVRLLKPSPGIDSSSASFLSYSVDPSFAADESGAKPSEIAEFKRYRESDAKSLLARLRQPTTCFAAQLSGRQTFCFLGASACVHPDPNGAFARLPNVITPTTASANHILIQSCHSPFVWNDFGHDYLTLPLAFLLRGNASTFVASTRVQLLAHGLLDMFLDLAASGTPVGQIVFRLNAHCRVLRVDEDPLVLFGHPDSRIIAERKHQIGPPPLTAELVARFRGHLYSLANTLQNIQFARDQLLELPGAPHLFDDDLRRVIVESRNLIGSAVSESASESERAFRGSAAEPTERLFRAERKFSNRDMRFCKALLPLTRHFQSHLEHLKTPAAVYATPTPDDVDAFAADVLSLKGHHPLMELSDRLLGCWPGQSSQRGEPDSARLGYYYNFNELMERVFLPVGAHWIQHQCPSCRSALLEKRSVFAGLTPAVGYQQRVQLVCPRCLVIRDVSDQCQPGFAAVFLNTDSGYQLTVLYKNLTDAPQFVFATAHWNDPNNVSMKSARGACTALLDGASLFPTRWKPTTLPAGDEVRFQAEISDLHAGIFYLLIEFHVFVDGCWNWLSFTVRRPGLRNWLNNDLYPGTLPGEKRRDEQ